MLNKRNIFIASLIVVTTLAYGLTNTSLTSAQNGATSQWCKGVNIDFMTGGNLGSGFADVVYNGAVQATADLGPTTNYIQSDWDVNKMISDFQTAMASHPDGIAVMGHPGDDSFKPLIDKAEAAGIIVTS